MYRRLRARDVLPGNDVEGGRLGEHTTVRAHEALGLSDERANASIRLGLGRFTTAADVDFAVDAIAAAAARLREGKAVQSAGAAPT